MRRPSGVACKWPAFVPRVFFAVVCRVIYVNLQQHFQQASGSICADVCVFDSCLGQKIDGFYLCTVNRGFGLLVLFVYLFMCSIFIFWFGYICTYVCIQILVVYLFIICLFVFSNYLFTCFIYIFMCWFVYCWFVYCWFVYCCLVCW